MMVGFPASLVLGDSLEIGKKVPGFSLSDPQGNKHSLEQYKGKYVILEWINHGCPFVQKHYDAGNMQKLQAEMAEKGIIWLSVCSSAKGKQGDMTPSEWEEATKEKGAMPTAILLDPSGKVGKEFGAKTTPHMFIVDPSGILIYNGAIDDLANFKDDLTKTNNYVKQAINEVLAGRTVTTSSTKPYGCSVKY